MRTTGRAHPPNVSHLRRRVMAGSLAMITAIALAACGGARGGSGDAGAAPTPSGTVLPDQSGETRSGGSVTALQTGLPARLDPVLASAFGFTSGGPMNAIFGLLLYSDAATNTIKMGFLESLEPDEDYKVWTAKLKPGLKFSDGTDFDAEAIAFNMKRAADESTGSLFLKDAKELTPEAIDKTTLKITLDKPNVHFRAVMAESFPYVGSPTAIKKLGMDFGTQPVGAGPFKVKSMDGTNTLVLERNPLYENYAKGEPRLDTLTFQAVPDFAKEAQALASGQAQIAAPYGGDAIASFQKQSHLYTLVNQTGAGSTLQMSMKRPPFDDVRAREAVTLALDRSAVANAFQPGTPAATNMFPPDSPFFNAKYDYPQRNKERAQQLFDELAAEGKPVEFEYLVPDQPAPLITAQLIQSQLAEFKNVKVTINSVTTADYVTNQRGGNYQMAPSGLYLINPIPSLQNFFVTGGTLNTTGYSNPKVDEAVDSLLTEDDPEKQKAAFDTIQEETLKDWAIYWVGKGLIGFAVNKDLTGVTPVNYGNTALWEKVGYRAEN